MKITTQQLAKLRKCYEALKLERLYIETDDATLDEIIDVFDEVILEVETQNHL